MDSQARAHPSDRAGGLRPEPQASQPKALIPCADGKHTSACLESIGECGIALCYEPKPMPREGLVDRLRNCWGDPYNASSHNPHLKMDCVIAADAIERLEARLAELGIRDSDGSGEAGETAQTGSTEGNSAGLQGIAQTPPPSGDPS